MTTKHALKHEGGYRVLVYGGRNYAPRVRIDPLPDAEAERMRLTAIEQRADVFRCLDRLRRERGILCVISGCAVGADDAGIEWAEQCGAPVARYPVTRGEWRTLGKRAGLVRNQRMLDEGCPDVAVEFPGGRGTADMRRRLGDKGVPVWEPCDATARVR